MASHRLFGRQLSRDTEHRIAMRRNLVQSLFEHGKVRTTMPKALEVRGMAEKLITLARAGTINARRRVIAKLQDRRLVDDKQEFITEGPTRTIVQKLFNDIAPLFKDRNGGYTRIIKTADHRIGDGGSIVSLQLVSIDATPKGTARRSLGLRRKRSERKHQFASKVLKKAKGTDKPAESSTSNAVVLPGETAPS